MVVKIVNNMLQKVCKPDERYKGSLFSLKGEHTMCSAFRSCAKGEVQNALCLQDPQDKVQGLLMQFKLAW